MLDTVGARVVRARERADLTQRALARKTAMPQATLSRLETGTRVAKMPEVIAIALATGSSVAELTGHSAVRDRAVCVARATDSDSIEPMREELLHYLELDAYLADQGIPQPL